MDGSDVRKFYNEYVPRQRSVGVNIRHLSILERLKRAGLKDTSNVLEIGCGIGTLTSLLARVVTRGSILATDISDESIDLARKEVEQDNIEFRTMDIVDHRDARKYDMIVMADVLEHVPVEFHPSIFNNLSSMMLPHSVLAINIPFPLFNAWAMQHTPEKMQIIDQALHTTELLNAAYPAGLHLAQLESYSLWNSPCDYQWIILHKNERITGFTALSKLQVIRKMLKLKFG